MAFFHSRSYAWGVDLKRFYAYLVMVDMCGQYLFSLLMRRLKISYYESSQILMRPQVGTNDLHDTPLHPSISGETLDRHQFVRQNPRRLSILYVFSQISCLTVEFLVVAPKSGLFSHQPVARLGVVSRHRQARRER